MFEIYTYIAEKERVKMLKRQEEAFEYRRKHGLPIGRPKAELPPNFDEYYKEWKAGKISAVKLFRDILKIPKSTFYKLVKEYETKIFKPTI